MADIKKDLCAAMRTLRLPLPLTHASKLLQDAQLAEKFVTRELLGLGAFADTTLR